MVFTAEESKVDKAELGFIILAQFSFVFIFSSYCFLLFMCLSSIFVGKLKMGED